MSKDKRETGDPADPESAKPTIDAASADGERDAGEEREDGPVRRPLIRATLTHPEGTPPTPRQPPVFTMHQTQPGASAPRGQNRGRAARQGGHANNGHPNKKNSRGGGQNASARGNSAGGNKWSGRPDRSGQPRSGNRSGTRRDKGRSR